MDAITIMASIILSYIQSTPESSACLFLGGENVEEPVTQALADLDCDPDPVPGRPDRTCDLLGELA